MNVHPQNLLSNGNIVFLLPRTSVDRRPLYINPLLGGLGERIVHGGGLFTDESKSNLLLAAIEYELLYYD